MLFHTGGQGKPGTATVLDVPFDDWQLRTPPAELARRYIADGSWNDDTLGQILAAGLADGSHLACKVRSRLRPYSGTLGDVADLARRVAGGLRARGVAPGDLVAFQLPNWMEAAATFWATAFLGAVPVPIVHFYGPKEVGFILRQSEARVFVTADRFGHLDYLANLDALRAGLPDLELVAVVADDAMPGDLLPFIALTESDPVGAPARVDPAAPALVAYTSGTTADPKGVVHAHRTIGFEIRQLGAMQPPRDGPPMLVGAPVGHGIGMLAALLLPVFRREPIHLIDVWDPSDVLAAMLEDHVYSGAGATFFLTTLLDHPDITDEHRALMRHVGLGGSAVPAAVGDRADAQGISIVRMYGSTEHPSITGSRHEGPRDKRLYTDGRPLPGVEIRLLDDDGKEVGAGTPGEIHSRGPDCFPGYTDPALTKECFDDDGWYATGDVGVLDDDGYLSIVDRKRDIIIRGGENVSAVEVEELVQRLPGVAEIAVVAAPDARLGERACAFVRPLPDQQVPSLDAVRAHLDAAGLARQKWPEELRAIDEFPRTPSGKIQKFALRDRLRQEPGDDSLAPPTGSPR
jgi:acyl-CoA synthetase